MLTHTALAVDDCVRAAVMWVSSFPKCRVGSGRLPYIAMEGYARVLKIITRPEYEDRLICPLHELEAPVQKAREKCTQLLQLCCFVSITLTYILYQ